MEPSTRPEIFNQEIAELEAKLAAKKRELKESGMELPEKEIFKHVVKEHAATEQAPVSFNPVTPVSPAPTRTTTKDDEQQLNHFVADAFTKGLAQAVKEARKTGDAFFIDLLHDRLADEYYQKLLQARKINSA